MFPLAGHLLGRAADWENLRVHHQIHKIMNKDTSVLVPVLSAILVFQPKISDSQCLCFCAFMFYYEIVY